MDIEIRKNLAIQADNERLVDSVKWTPLSRSVDKGNDVVRLYTCSCVWITGVALWTAMNHISTTCGLEKKNKLLINAYFQHPF